MADSTTFDQVARGVCERLGWIFEDIQTKAQWRPIRTAINAALRKEWQNAWPEDLMRIERLTLRPTWSAASTYAPTDADPWVWHDDSDAYYVSLQSSTNEAPASWDGTEWDTNLTYWARLDEPESVDQGDWTDGTAYVLGDRVTWHGDTYACISAHTASASILPSNTTYWGPVPDFDWVCPSYQSGRTVIGRGREAAEQNPRLWPGATRMPFEHTATGVRFAESRVTRPWLEYRIRAPQLIGEAWDQTATYTEEDDNKAIYGK